VKKARTGHLLVRPIVNGRDSGWHIFDTGAGVCVASTDCVEKLGLERTGDIDASGSGSTARAPMYRAKEVRLGPMRLADHPIMAVDLGFLEQHLGEKISGVIGYGVFSQCVAVIEIAGPSISLHDPAQYTLDRGSWTPLDLSERVPVIAATFEGHEGRFMLDTGDHAHITFNEPAVRKWDLLSGRELSDSKLGGVGGFVAAKKGRIDRLEIGGRKLDHVPASFALEARGTHTQTGRTGRIGAGVLENFVMVVDYGKQRIALVSRQSDPKE
jgi:predicted aspartyl protease